MESVNYSITEMLYNEEKFKELLQFWESKTIEKISQVNEDYKYLMDNTDDVSLKNKNKILNIIDNIIKTKALIDCEYDFVNDLKSELEDNKSIQELKAKNSELNEKLLELEQENNNLMSENEILKIELQTFKINESQVESDVSRRVEKVRMDTSYKMTSNEVHKYRLTTDIDDMSDSEHSATEEDSLEHDKKKKSPAKHNKSFDGPETFNMRLRKSNGMTSTPIKDNNTIATTTTPTNTNSMHITAISKSLFNDKVDNASVDNIIKSIHEIPAAQSFNNSLSTDVVYNPRYNKSKIENWELTGISFSQDNLDDIHNTEFEQETEKIKSTYTTIIGQIGELYKKLYCDESNATNIGPTGDGAVEEDEYWIKLQKIYEKINDKMMKKSKTKSNKSIASKFIGKFSLKKFKKPSPNNSQKQVSIESILNEDDNNITSNYTTNNNTNNKIKRPISDSRVIVMKRNFDDNNNNNKNQQSIMNVQSSYDALMYKFQKYSEISVKLICHILNFISEYTGNAPKPDMTFQVTQELQSLMNRNFNMTESTSLFDTNLNVKSEIKEDLEYQLENLYSTWKKRFQNEQAKAEEYELLYKESERELLRIKSNYQEQIDENRNQILDLERKLKEKIKFNDQQTELWQEERNKHRDEIKRLNHSYENLKIKIRNEQEDHEPERVQRKPRSIPRPRSLQGLSRNIDSQTDRRVAIFFTEDLTVKDLLTIPQINPIIKKLVDEQEVTMNAFHIFLDAYLMFASKLHLNNFLTRLVELRNQSKETLLDQPVNFWTGISEDLDLIERKFGEFMIDSIEIRKDNVILKEELEVQKSREKTKEDLIGRIETENQQLLDYQQELQNDYSILQSMNEDTQRKLEEVTENIIKIEQRNDSFNEREEDLYLLQEKKNELEGKLKEFEELKQNEIKKLMTNSEMEIKELKLKIEELNQELISKTTELQIKETNEDQYRHELIEMKEQHLSMESEMKALKYELEISVLRLDELKEQNRNDIEKLKRCWEDTEDLMVKNCSFKTESTSSMACQTELTCKLEDKVDLYNTYQVALMYKNINIENLLASPISSEGPSITILNETDDSQCYTPTYTINDKIIQKYCNADCQTCDQYPFVIKINANLDQFLINGSSESNERINFLDWIKVVINEIENLFGSSSLKTFSLDMKQDIETKIKYLQNIIKELHKTTMDDLLNKIQQMEKVNKELSEKGAFLIGELKNTESQHKTDRHNLEESTQKLQRLATENTSLYTNLAKLSDEKRDLQIKMKTEIDELKRQMKGEQNQRDIYNSKIIYGEERMKSYKEEIEQQQKEIRSLKNQLQQSTDEHNLYIVESHKDKNLLLTELENTKQKYQYLNEENEKLRMEIIKTVKSHESYREQMNINMSKYQENRDRMKREIADYTKTLQTNYREQVSLYYEQETMRLENHKLESENKELKRKLKETEKSLCKLHMDHDLDRQTLMKSLSNNEINSDCENMLDQINFLLRKVQIMMDIYDCHLSKPHDNSSNSHGGTGGGVGGATSSCGTSNSIQTTTDSIRYTMCSGEVNMLRKSIENMQAMIKIYMESLKNNCTGDYSRHSNNLSAISRPKPMGSSNSFDGSDNNDASLDSSMMRGIRQNSSYCKCGQSISLFDLKKQLSKAKIDCINLKKNNENMHTQKQLLLQSMSRDKQIAIFSYRLTERQNRYTRNYSFIVRFRAAVIAIKAINRFKRFVETQLSSYEKHYQRFPMPKFSTSTPKKSNGPLDSSIEPPDHERRSLINDSGSSLIRNSHPPLPNYYNNNNRAVVSRDYTTNRPNLTTHNYYTTPNSNYSRYNNNNQGSSVTFSNSYNSDSLERRSSKAFDDINKLSSIFERHINNY